MLPQIDWSNLTSHRIFEGQTKSGGGLRVGILFEEEEEVFKVERKQEKYLGGMGDLGRNLLQMQRLSDAVEKEEEKLKQHDKDMDLMV
jgi:hypothetical protein